MTPTRENFEQYAKLKLAEASIKEQLDALKGIIMAELQDVEEDTVTLPEYGNFIVVRRKNWIYSDGVYTLANELKEMKAEEEGRGTAKFEIAETFMFKANPKR